MRAAAVLLGLALSGATPASAATIHGLVYDDANGDGKPSTGEPGIANAVVAFDVHHFTTSDATGQFTLHVPEGMSGIVWVKVPDGFRPGPVWGLWAGGHEGEVDLGLHRLAAPIRGPLTFVVAADTHLASTRPYFGATDLAAIAREATALDPPPAFFTILGDVTQGNQPAEFDMVDTALAELGVPFVPVPGNHDWYDDGETWFKRYGPDNYSFDVAGVHFVVWNMAMTDGEIRAYLGAELSYVPHGMPIVALTHAPPSLEVLDALRELGVAYVLTGHAHSNRVVDHDGVIELNTEPLLMGGLDFTPAGYRVVTIDGGSPASIASMTRGSGGQLRSYHRSVVEAPQLAIVAPARGTCTPARGGELLVAAELDAAASVVTARVDCATPIALRWVGGWSFRGELPALAPGAHAIAVDATSASGAHTTATATIETCPAAGAPPPPPPAPVDDWPQLGGDAAHTNARPRELAPPLATRWTVAVGGHVLTAPPAIAGNTVYIAVTDLGDGAAGGVVALDLATGALRWRAPTPVAIRGGIAVVPSDATAPVTTATVVAAQIDGVVLGLDATTGAVRWRHELAPDAPPQARALFGSPTVEDHEILVGNQRALAALAGHTGTPRWSVDPVPAGVDSQSLAAVAVDAATGVAIGAFNRAIGGVSAWDRASGAELWRVQGEDVIAVNASPVIARAPTRTVFVATGADAVVAIDELTGALRWKAKLDPAGFNWGNATVGTPAFAHGILVVPTLYRDLVALDAQTGAELWRRSGEPAALRATHYRGAREAGFAASPIITGDIVWSVDTSGELVARALLDGEPLWRTQLGVPVLAGLAAAGDALVVASYDGTVRALARTTAPPSGPAPAPLAATCAAPAPTGGCCDASGGRSSPGSTALLAAFVLAATRRRRA